MMIMKASSKEYRYETAGWYLGEGGWKIMMSGSSWQDWKDGEYSSRILTQAGQTH